MKALEILVEAFNRFDNVGLSWSTGKDSTLCLYIVKEMLRKDIPIIFTDTLNHFDETYQFLELLKEKWRLNIHIAKPKKNKVDVMMKNRECCCHYHKTLPFLEKVNELDLDAIIVGIRRDEHPSRRDETYFSERQGHTRVHPILHLTWSDVLMFCSKYDIPMNPLYKKGYTSIGCQPCTFPNPLENEERAGRVQDKEKVLKHLRELGYF